MIGYHECANCQRTSYCGCKSCRPHAPEGAVYMEWTADDNAIICPFCHYIEGADAAEERSMARYDSTRGRR